MTISPEQRLFQAVVTNAVIDATSVPKPVSRSVKRKKSENDLDYAARRRKIIAAREANASNIRDSARDWLLGGGLSFEQVCTLAGYDPADVRERALRLADRGWQPSRRFAA